jgi:hypothetical protein
VRYLVESSGGESFTYESDTAPGVGETILDRREGVSRGYIVRVVEPGRDDFDGIIRADWAGEVGPAQARYEP